MAQELRIDRFSTGIAFTYETKERMMIKFAKPGERFGTVVGRVCENLVKGVKLPKSVHDEIDKKIKENYDKRMLNRLNKNRKKTSAK